MFFEWIVYALIGAMRALMSVVENLVPGFNPSAVSSVIGTANSLNAVLPVAEAVTVGASMLAWRLLAGPVTAIIGRWKLGFDIW
jgi:hypothetical protein